MRAKQLAMGLLIVTFAAMPTASPAFAQTSGGNGQAADNPNSGPASNTQVDASRQGRQYRPAKEKGAVVDDRQTRNQRFPGGHRGLVGREIRNIDFEAIGEIENILVGLDGDKVQAVVAVGGFWGIGEERRIVPLNQFRLTQKRPYIFFMGTHEELAQFPVYREPGRARPSDIVASRTYYPPRDAYGYRGDIDMMPHRYGWVPEDPYGYPFQSPSDYQGYYPESGISRSGVQGLRMQGESHAGRESQRHGLVFSDIAGRDVVNAQNEVIGEVEDLIIGRNGQAHLVLSVGGFLGVGEKRIRADLQDVDLSDPGYAFYDISRQELENEPAYAVDGRPSRDTVGRDREQTEQLDGDAQSKD